MFGGIALPVDRLPVALLTHPDITHRVYERLGVREVQFLAREGPCQLPVLLGGELRVLAWGNRRGDCRRLPCTLWTSQATFEAGGWAHADAEEVVIPAALGFDSGIWFKVTTGVRGLVVADEHGQRRVYPILEPADQDYEVMTKSKWMPCLVGGATPRSQLVR